jgi:hypothetical protein
VAADFQPIESKNQFDLVNREEWMEASDDAIIEDDEFQNEMKQYPESTKPMYRKYGCLVVGPGNRQAGPIIAFVLHLVVLAIASYFLTTKS